jgi:hypothetical protein
VRELTGAEPPGVPPADLAPDTTTVLVATGALPPGDIDPAWHRGIALGAITPRLLSRPHAGWLVAADIDTLFQAVDIIAKTAQVNAIGELSRANSSSPLLASVVVCTNRELTQLLPTLEAVAGQELHGGAFEVIVVDNAGRDEEEFRTIHESVAGPVESDFVHHSGIVCRPQRRLGSGARPLRLLPR